MSTESIQFSLNQRFAAPLPEFYRRRIVFWLDPDREFENMVDELSLSNVHIIKLTGTNNFAIKKLLVHDDPDSNYLIYDPFSYDDPKEDWLLDVKLFSEEYRADKISMQMAELNIESTPSMRKTVRLYEKFFDSKDRTQKLIKLGGHYTAPLQLHIDIMAVLTGAKQNTAQDVFIAALEAGVDCDANQALVNLKKFGNVEAFWQLAQKYTGYAYAVDDPVRAFAVHVLLTALTQTMGCNVLKGLENFVSESNQAYCYSLVNEWRSREDNHELYRLCRMVEREAKLSARFHKMDVDELISGDVFPLINECILEKLFEQVADRTIRLDLLQRTVENRRISGWYNNFRDYYESLNSIGDMLAFYQENVSGFHFASPKAVWEFYTQKGYLMDTAYRKFHLSFGNTLKDSNVMLEDPLKHAADYVENLYRNWFLGSLTECWTNSMKENLRELGYVSEVRQQRDFFQHYVRPNMNKGRTFVIISDALRYEVASELRDRIVRTTNGTATLESCQSVFPSITKFGMSALLPGTEISVTESMDVLVDNLPTRSTVDRQGVLTKTEANSVAIQYQDLLAMKRAERRELTNGKAVVYIYHNVIDAIGDKAPTETKVFDACETAIQEISNLLRIVVNDMQGTDVYITADHGFLYTYQSLSEGDKLSKSAVQGNIYEIGRRYILAEEKATADYLLPVNVKQRVKGIPMQGFTPLDATRLKITGGGENFVHGGVSLQEMVVPVLVFKNVRTSSKKYVEIANVELTLLSESRKVSNLIFSLDFFQRQPVGEKTQPCTYSAYMEDENSVIVSDQQTIIADKTSSNASDRVFHVRFNLKAGSYDAKRAYRLVITNGVDVPEEVEFHIDIAFADDFNFFS